MTNIKICGITNLKDAKVAVDLGVNVLGFIFYPKSPRSINFFSAKQIIEQLPPVVDKTGIFVDERREVVERIAKSCKLNILQFHGNEDFEYCNEFKKAYRVMKAIRVKNKKSILNISSYLSLDYILLDTYVKKIAGGTGKQFNWDLAAIAKKRFNVPIVLSGGLNPDNVKEAIRKVKPYMVDVSSGVESSPGKKDHKLMKEFVERVIEVDNKL